MKKISRIEYCAGFEPLQSGMEQDEGSRILLTLQGNFDVKKLHGVYRPMMEIMVKTAGKALAEKKDRTPEEDDMLDMMLHGGERVKEENLGAVLDWYSAQR